MKKAAILSLVIASLLTGHPSAARAEQSEFMTCWEKNQAHYTHWRKAGRGLTNLTLGWTEILYQPAVMHAEGNRIQIAVLGGVLKGAFLGVIRTLVGAFEFVTFPFPVPNEYRPLIFPEVPIPAPCSELAV